MDIDETKLREMASLSDDVFGEKLEEALNAAGATDSVKAKFAQNIPQIKKALDGLSARDLELLAQKLDGATIDALKDSLGE